ncbi:hypothetical protein [Aeromonas rivipollensis]|uniref:hypothetical protein n=1 Tax=Aeromonas rivipollensis TaxID=948519 RepID=UPI0038D90071
MISYQGLVRTFPSVLRDFRRASTPRVEIKSPFGLGLYKPPTESWENINFGDLGHYEVVFLERHNEDIDVPDDVLPQVFSILVEQLITSSGLLRDIGTSYFQIPTCYPDRQVDGKNYITKAVEVVIWFVQLFDRLAAKWPELANAYVTTWSATDKFFFRKLKLYAFSKVNVFEANYVAEEVLSLDQEAFWDMDISRELLFLLVDRWREFSQDNQNKIIDRILTGCDKRPHLSDEDYPMLRDEFAARYARYLELQGCELTVDRSQGGSTLC